MVPTLPDVHVLIQIDKNVNSEGGKAQVCSLRA